MIETSRTSKRTRKLSYIVRRGYDEYTLVFYFVDTSLNSYKLFGIAMALILICKLVKIIEKNNLGGRLGCLVKDSHDFIHKISIGLVLATNESSSTTRFNHTLCHCAFANTGYTVQK
jgi:hypothetical protein